MRPRAAPLPRAVVLGDEAQVGRMLANLVENALRHARTTVGVRLAVERGQAVIAVEDDGPGIAPPIGSVSGTASAGRPTTARAPGRGSVFLVRLPLYRPTP